MIQMQRLVTGADANKACLVNTMWHVAYFDLKMMYYYVVFVMNFEMIHSKHWALDITVSVRVNYQKF